MAQVERVTQTTKKKWWGLSSKTKTNVSRTDADAGTQNAIEQAYASGVKAIIGMGEALGVEGAEGMLQSFTGSLHKLNLDGKSTDEIAQMINGAIGTDLEQMSMLIAPWLTDFQRAGEEFLETAGRVVYEMELVDQAFDTLGGSMSFIGESAVRVSQAFIEASGGMDNALSNINGYISNFYNDEEKQALRIKELKATGLFSSEKAYKAEVDRLRKASTGTIRKEAYTAYRTATRQVEKTIPQSNIWGGMFGNRGRNSNFGMFGGMGDYGYGGGSSWLQQLLNRNKPKTQMVTEKYQQGYTAYRDKASDVALRARSAKQLAELIRQQDQYRQYFDYINDAKEAQTQAEKKRLEDLAEAERERVEAEEKILNAKKEAVRGLIDFNNKIMTDIIGAYTGNLSYLNSQEKAEYLKTRA
ncbi:MAG: hypothetical protein KAH30_04975, partial [Caldisericia bacterium]|nr:hypothetical protein [Caldisericia bacterium]